MALGRLDLCLSLKQLLLLPLTLPSWCSQLPKSLWSGILVCLEPSSAAVSWMCHSSGHFAALLHLRQAQTLQQEAADPPCGCCIPAIQIPGFSDGM